MPELLQRILAATTDACPLGLSSSILRLMGVGTLRGQVEEDRKHAIEATIVRVMKARRIMTHQQLVIEVSAQIKLFKPDTKLIKNRIEDLIWREVRGTLRDLAILATLVFESHPTCV
jgi:cullin 1